MPSPGFVIWRDQTWLHSGRKLEWNQNIIKASLINFNNFKMYKGVIFGQEGLNCKNVKGQVKYHKERDKNHFRLT